MESGFISLLQSWGPSAASSMLILVVLLLIKKIEKDSRKDEERALKLREDINNTLNSFGERLSKIENEYVKNDFFYRELSGWRREINRMSDQVSNNFTLLIQQIMQLLSRGGKNE